jgi:hypothetical protein
VPEHVRVRPADPHASCAGRLRAGRDSSRPARLLRAEHDALLPILARTPDAAFDQPTVLPGWSVRDVLAHCAAVLSRVTGGDLHAFTPDLNEIDVAARRPGRYPMSSPSWLRATWPRDLSWPGWAVGLT